MKLTATITQPGHWPLHHNSESPWIIISFKLPGRWVGCWIKLRDGLQRIGGAPDHGGCHDGKGFYQLEKPVQTEIRIQGWILTCYSKSKGILHCLKRGNSIVGTNTLFLKAYFSMSIDALEIQSEVKKFLMDPSSNYSQNLESIHLYYWA